MKQSWAAQIHRIRGVELLTECLEADVWDWARQCCHPLFPTPSFWGVDSWVHRCIFDRSPLFLCSDLLGILAVAFDQDPMDPSLNCWWVSREPHLFSPRHPALGHRCEIKADGKHGKGVLLFLQAPSCRWLQLPIQGNWEKLYLVSLGVICVAHCPFYSVLSSPPLSPPLRVAEIAMIATI